MQYRVDLGGFDAGSDESLGGVEGERIFLKHFLVALDGGAILARVFVQSREREIDFGAAFSKADGLEDDDGFFVLAVGEVASTQTILDLDLGDAVR